MKLIQATLILAASTLVQAAPPIWESNYGTELEDLTGEDDEEQRVDLPFTFPFEGAGFDQMFVGTNGCVQLGSLGNDDVITFEMWRADTFDQFNDDGAPLICPFHSDLDLNEEGIIRLESLLRYYRYDGGEGDQVIVTWDEVGTFTDEFSLLTFQLQLFLDGTIVFGYNGILDNEGEGLIESLDEGIVVGITKSNGTDDGPLDLKGISGHPTEVLSNTIYEIWCLDDENNEDCHEPGGQNNSAFDLDQTNVVFTPLHGGGFVVSDDFPAPVTPMPTSPPTPMPTSPPTPMPTSPPTPELRNDVDDDLNFFQQVFRTLKDILGFFFWFI